MIWINLFVFYLTDYNEKNCWWGKNYQVASPAGEWRKLEDTMK